MLIQVMHTIIWVSGLLGEYATMVLPLMLCIAAPASYIQYINIHTSHNENWEDGKAYEEWVIKHWVKELAS